MTLHQLQSLSDDVRRDASREYHHQRQSLTVREIVRESDEEIRAAIRTGAAVTASGRDYFLNKEREIAS